MPHFVALYAYTDDLAGRDRVRPEHREFLASQESLVASGPTGTNGALLVFESESEEDVEALLDADPFAAAGFIATRAVTRWDIVLGRWAQQA